MKVSILTYCSREGGAESECEGEKEGKSEKEVERERQSQREGEMPELPLKQLYGDYSSLEDIIMCNTPVSNPVKNKQVFSTFNPQPAFSDTNLGVNPINSQFWQSFISEMSHSEVCVYASITNI